MLSGAFLSFRKRFSFNFVPKNPFFSILQAIFLHFRSEETLSLHFYSKETRFNISLHSKVLKCATETTAKGNSSDFFCFSLENFNKCKILLHVRDSSTINTILHRRRWHSVNWCNVRKTYVHIYKWKTWETFTLAKLTKKISPRAHTDRKTDTACYRICPCEILSLVTHTI